MNLDFFVVMSNLVSLFSLIAVGFIAVRSGVLKPEASASFASFLMKITLPCTIFILLIQKEYDPAFVHDSMVIIIAGLVVFSGMLYLSRYIAILLGVPETCRGVWAFGASFTNAGFMGFPIALALFGSEGLALSVMLNVAFNMTVYTIGAIEITHDNPNHNAEKLKISSIIFSGINIALVLSLIFYFGQIKLHPLIAAPIKYLSDITTPLSMIIIGMALAHSKGSEVLKDKYAWTCTFMRLVVYPVTLCGILRIFTLSSNPLVSAVLILVVAMPGASVTTVLAEIYHGNVEFAARIMFLQNVLCMITIPAVCMLIG